MLGPLSEILKEYPLILTICLGIFTIPSFLILIFRVGPSLVGSLTRIIGGVRNRLRDYLKLNQLKVESPTSWSLVCQIADSFLTDSGQAQYFNLLLTKRIDLSVSKDDSLIPSLKGPLAEEQSARLRERLYDLQE